MHIPWAIDPTTPVHIRVQITNRTWPERVFRCEFRNNVDFVVVCSIAFSIRHFNRKSIYNVVFIAQRWQPNNSKYPHLDLWLIQLHSINFWFFLFLCLSVCSRYYRFHSGLCVCV